MHGTRDVAWKLPSVAVPEVPVRTLNALLLKERTLLLARGDMGADPTLLPLAKTASAAGCWMLGEGFRQ